MYAISCAFRRGVALVGEFLNWALLTPFWDPLLGIGGVTGKWRSDEAVIMKKVDMWP